MQFAVGRQAPDPLGGSKHVRNYVRQFLAFFDVRWLWLLTCWTPATPAPGTPRHFGFF